MKRAIGMCVAYVAFAFALFVFMHTGSRAEAACGAQGSYSIGTGSFWPPGTGGAGPGPPASTILVFQVGYGGVLPFATIVLGAVGLITGARINASHACPADAADR